jgi:hypothetical protein
MAILLVIIVLSLIVLISSSGHSRISLLIPHSVPPPQEADGDNDVAANRSTVHLQVVVYGSAEESEWMMEEAQIYTERHPYLRIEWITWPDTVDFETVIRHIRYDVQADLYLLDNVWVQGLAAKGLLEPVAASGQGSMDPAVRQLLEWNGFAWAVPYYIEPYVVVWNRNAEPIADENGLVRFDQLRETLVSRMDRWMESREASRMDSREGDMTGDRPEEDRAEPESSGYEWELADWSVYFDMYDPISAIYAMREEDEFTARLMEQAAGMSPAWKPGQYFAPPRESWEHLKDGRIAAMIVPVTHYVRQRDARLGASPLLDDRSIGEGGQMWSRGKSFAIRADSSRKEAARQLVDWLAASGVPNALPGLPPHMADGSGNSWTMWLSPDLKAVRDWLPSAKFLTGTPELPGQLDAYRKDAASYRPGSDVWRSLVSEVSRIANPASSFSF